MFCILFAKVVKLFPNILPHMDNLSVLYCKRNPISPPHRDFLIQGSATPIFSGKSISTLRQSNYSSNQFISRDFQIKSKKSDILHIFNSQRDILFRIIFSFPKVFISFYDEKLFFVDEKVNS